MKERISNVPGETDNQQSAGAPIDIEDPTALRRLAKEVLVEIVQKSPRNVSLVAAIRELLDRVDGKPAQSQVVDLNVKGDVQHYHNIELSADLLKEQIGRILKKKPTVLENKPQDSV